MAEKCFISKVSSLIFWTKKILINDQAIKAFMDGSDPFPSPCKEYPVYDGFTLTLVETWQWRIAKVPDQLVDVGIDAPHGKYSLGVTNTLMDFECILNAFWCMWKHFMVCENECIASNMMHGLGWVSSTVCFMHTHCYQSKPRDRQSNFKTRHCRRRFRLHQSLGDRVCLIANLLLSYLGSHFILTWHMIL